MYPLVDRGGAFSALVFVALFAVLLGREEYQKAATMFFDWFLWLKAFGFALIFWSVIALIRAPFSAWYKDRSLGKWSKNHFLYNDPQLVFSNIIAPEQGKTQAFKVVFKDALPNAMVSIEFEIDGYNLRMRDSVLYQFIGGPKIEGFEITPTNHPNLFTPYLRPGCKLSMRLNRRRQVFMYIRIAPEQTPKTVKVYCKGFFVGKESDF